MTSGHAAPWASSGLVTGDAVVVELRLAKLPSRALAFGIDLLLQVLALLGLTFVATALIANVDATLGTVVVLLVVLSIFVGYPVACETLTRGRTLGKLALGLRVVRDDGGPERLRHALVRGLMGAVELYVFFGFLAIVTSLVSETGKRIGDHLAGTVVVRERVPTPHVPLPALMPHLQPWAATLDLTRLPESLAMSVRSFLGRATRLQVAARAELARNLATDVVRYVPCQRGDWMSDELFLQTVLAERRRRAVVASPPPNSDSAAAPPVAVQPTEVIEPVAPDTGDAGQGNVTPPS